MATKLCRMTVSVPIDEHLPVGLVHKACQEALESLGTCNVTIPPVADGQDNPDDKTGSVLMSDLSSKGRIHWPAVDVVQSVVTRVAAAAPRARRATAV